MEDIVDDVVTEVLEVRKAFPRATRLFLRGAKGSFGLCVNSSLDAHRQLVLAARGQTISLAVYPASRIICTLNISALRRSSAVNLAARRSGMR